MLWWPTQTICCCVKFKSTPHCRHNVICLLFHVSFTEHGLARIIAIFPSDMCSLLLPHSSNWIDRGQLHAICNNLREGICAILAFNDCQSFGYPLSYTHWQSSDSVVLISTLPMKLQSNAMICLPVTNQVKYCLFVCYCLPIKSNIAFTHNEQTLKGRAA